MSIVKQILAGGTWQVKWITANTWNTLNLHGDQVTVVADTGRTFVFKTKEVAGTLELWDVQTTRLFKIAYRDGQLMFGKFDPATGKQVLTGVGKRIGR